MKNNKKGFTLVELVIVVAVMAVLVAVAIPTVSSIVGSAETSVDNSNAKVIESMIKLEQAEKKDTVTVGTDLIDTAITDAQLGIDGYFKYDSVTGIVTPIEEKDVIDDPDDLANVAKTTFYIVCDKDAEDTKDNTGAVTETALAKSVKVYQGTMSAGN